MKFKQIVAAGSRLYALAEDSTVWMRTGLNTLRGWERVAAPHAYVTPIEISAIAVQCTLQRTNDPEDTNDYEHFWVYALTSAGAVYELLDEPEYWTPVRR